MNVLMVPAAILRGVPKRKAGEPIPAWCSRIAEAVSPHGKLKQIADLAGMTSPQLQKIANGSNRNPRIQTLERIAAAMKMSVDDLLADARPEGSVGRERSNGGEGSGARIEDRLGDLLAYIKTLEGKQRTDFIRAVIALLTALEHARPAASSGTASDDGR